MSPVPGEETSRSGAADRPAAVECAGAVVRDDAGRLLLVRRANPPGAGRWSLPGGRIEDGETPAVAAAREVREETGLDVTVGALLATVDLAGGYRVHDFAATVVGGSLRAGDDAAEVRWCAADDVRVLDVTEGLVDELRRMGVL